MMLPSTRTGFGERFGNRSGAVDEGGDDGRQGPVLHRQYDDRPRVFWQIDWQHLQSKAMGIEIGHRIWKRGNELPTGKQIGAEMNGQGFQAHLGHANSSLAKGFCHNFIVPGIWPC